MAFNMRTLSHEEKQSVSDMGRRMAIDSLQLVNAVNNSKYLMAAENLESIEATINELRELTRDRTWD